jgi:crotonobetainyl-CoA:carnitine CoA-transferase CaiB-like acyl-CoA transferase
MPGNPVKLSLTNEDTFTPPPHLGQNTQEILKEWANYNDSQIKELVDSGIIQVKS